VSFLHGLPFQSSGGVAIHLTRREYSLVSLTSICIISHLVCVCWVYKLYSFIIWFCKLYCVKIHTGSQHLVGSLSHRTSRIKLAFSQIASTKLTARRTIHIHSTHYTTQYTTTHIITCDIKWYLKYTHIPTYLLIIA